MHLGRCISFLASPTHGFEFKERKLDKLSRNIPKHGAEDGGKLRRVDWTISDYNSQSPLDAEVFRLIDGAFTSNLALDCEALGTIDEKGQAYRWTTYYKAVYEIIKVNVAEASAETDSDDVTRMRQTILAKFKYIYTPGSSLFIGYWPILTPSTIVAIEDVLTITPLAMLEVSKHSSSLSAFANPHLDQTPSAG